MSAGHTEPPLVPVFPGGDGLAALQHSLLRVPVEALAKFTRTAQKLADKEAAAAVAAVKRLAVPPEEGEAPLARRLAAAAKAAKTLEAAARRVKGVKRKLGDLAAQTDKYARRLRVRAAHYEALKADEAEEQEAKRLEREAEEGDASASSAAAAAQGRADGGWCADPDEAERLAADRMIAQCLHRLGYHRTAERLVADAGLADLVDVEIFRVAEQVLAGLAARDCTKALQWCGANRSRLARLGSSLEFELHLQAFVELARAGRAAEAVAHARERLGPAAAGSEERAARVREAMGALAFCAAGGGGGGDDGGNNAAPAPDNADNADNAAAAAAPRDPRYASMFAESRWEALGDLFRRELYRLNGLPARPLLEVVLEAGLHALKTPQCSSDPAGESHSSRCPVCSPLGERLGAHLPVSHRVHSRLVCRLSGRVMDEHNPPLAMPNGSVFSTAALRAMAARDGGRVTDPDTGERFSFIECRTVYIL